MKYMQHYNLTIIDKTETRNGQDAKYKRNQFHKERAINGKTWFHVEQS
jgi:hypothetical protein